MQKNCSLAPFYFGLNGCGLFLSKAIECVMTKDRGDVFKDSFRSVYRRFQSNGGVTEI